MTEAKKAMLKRMAKARKKASTPAARKKAKATRAATMARKNAEAAREFAAVPFPVPAKQGTDIPLHAIPARTKAAKQPVKPKQPIQPFDPAETVQIVAGNFRVTVERFK